MCTVFRMVCMVGISVILASGPAWAKPGEIVQWLMDRPLTLWDMGVIRIEEAAEKAASRTKLGSYDVAVHYVWDYDEITVSFSGRRIRGQATHEKCNEIRRSFIADMAGLNRRLPNSMLQNLLTGTVSSWFSHKGFKAAGRDMMLGAKLANKIYIEIVVLSALSPKGIVESAIQCNERITTLDALSKPTAVEYGSAIMFPPDERADALRPRPSPKNSR